MSIKNRFGDNLLASTNLNPGLVPALETAAKGPISSPAGLDQIADSVQTNLQPAAGNTSHARPAMFAHITSFVANVRKAIDAVIPGGAGYDSLDADTKKDFTEWQGMVAAVALNHVYSGKGLNLSIDTLTLGATHAEQCILMEISKYWDFKKPFAPSAAAMNQIHYICQNGEPFAIFHPEIGLCPMKEYDAAIFDDVLPWHQKTDGDCHAGWSSFTEPKVTMDDFCLYRIEWWAGKNGLVNFQKYIAGKKANPAYIADQALAPATPSMPNAANINATWSGRGTAFGTSMMLYQDAAKQPCGMPDLFLDTMMIADTGGDGNNKLVYNSSTGEQPITFAGKIPALANYAPVAPFRKEAAKLLDTCVFDQISFSANMGGAGLESVKVLVHILTNTNETFAIEKEYASSQLRLCKLPYVMVWPFLPMPAGLWKQYYATWREPVAAMGVPSLCNENGVSISSATGLRCEFNTTKDNVSRFTEPTDQWEVYTNAAPFRYAELTDAAHNTLGMIFVPEIPTMVGKPVNPGDQVKLSIDFGTTSSICAMQSPLLNKGAITPLPFKDYSRTVTCADDKAKEILDSQHWLGDLSRTPSGWNEKIFSVTQLFQRAGGPNFAALPIGGNHKYYADGRLFLVSSGAIMGYAAAAKDVPNPLGTQKIINDMKFLVAGAHPENYHAASLFLAGLYTYAVLYLFDQNIVPGSGGFIDLCASYPNAVTLGALQANWRTAQGILNQLMAPTLTSAIAPVGGAMQFYSEATAATAYHRFYLGSPLKTTNRLISMDIGGGTTDISITNAPPAVPGAAVTVNMRKVSVRYAGREIMVDSLIEYYRRFAPTADFDRNTVFLARWGTAPDTTVLANQFIQTTNAAPKTATKLRALTDDQTLRMYVEMLLADDIDMGPIFPTSDTNWLRQLIALKFMMSLRIAARSMRENIDMWQDPDGTYPAVLDINLSVSGTSAQMLQYVFDTNLLGLAALSGAVPPAGPMGKCLAVFNQIFTDELVGAKGVPAGTNTQLHIFVDQNVKDKREVSYGMLEPLIGTLTIAGPVAAPLADGAAAAATKAMVSKIATHPMEAFTTYLDQLKGYLQSYENIYFAGSPSFDFGLGSGISKVSDLLNHPTLTSYYAGSIGAVVSHAPFMIAPEQAPYTDLLMNMYLMDEIINQMMAALQ